MPKIRYADKRFTDTKVLLLMDPPCAHGETHERIVEWHANWHDAIQSLIAFARGDDPGQVYLTTVPF